MPIVGTAEVLITANDSEFESSLEEGTQPGFTGLESDAEIAGTDAGTALKTGAGEGLEGLDADLAGAGQTAGLALRDGAGEGVQGLEDDMGRVGQDAGAALQAGAAPGLAGISSDAERAGGDAGEALRDGAAPGLAGLSGDMGVAGEDSGTALRDGAATAAGGLSQDLEGVGRESGTALREGAAPGLAGISEDAGMAGANAGASLREGVNPGLSGLGADAERSGERMGANLRVGAVNALEGNASSVGGLGLKDTLTNVANPAFIGLQTEATTAGNTLGTNLVKGTALNLEQFAPMLDQAGVAGATSLKTGFAPGLTGLSSDAEKAATGIGSALSTELNLEGGKAGGVLRTAITPSWTGLSTDATTAGEKMGANLRLGAVNALQGNATTVESQGLQASLNTVATPAFTGLATQGTTAGEQVGSNILKGTTQTLEPLAGDFEQAGVTAGAALSTAASGALDGLGTDLANAAKAGTPALTTALSTDVGAAAVAAGTVLEEDFGTAGEDAANALRVGIAPGLLNVEEDVALAGTAAGTAGATGIREGVSNETQNITNTFGDLGVAGGEALNVEVAAKAEKAAVTLAETGGLTGIDYAEAISSGISGSADFQDLTSTLFSKGEAAGAAMAAGGIGATDVGTADIEQRYRETGDNLANTASVIGASTGTNLRSGFDKAGAGLSSDAERISTDAGNKLESGFSRLGSLLSNLPFGDLGIFGAAAESASGKVESLGHTSTAAGEKLTGFAKLGRDALVGLTAGLATAAVAGGKMAVDFQSNVASLASSAGISTKAAQSIGTAFLHSGSDVAFSAAKQIQALTPVAGQLTQIEGGSLNAANASKFMATAMDLTEESGGDLTSTVSDLTSVLQQFHQPASMATADATDLYNAARITGSSVDQVSSTVENLGSKLGAAAPSVSQLSSLILDAGEHGVTSSKGLSSLSSAMTTLLKPTEDQAKAQLALKQATDALPPSLDHLAEQYRNNQISTKDLSGITQLFTTTQATAFSAYTKASAGLTTANSAVKDAGIQVETSGGKLEGFGSIIGELDDKIKGETQTQALATLSTYLGTSANLKLLETVEAGPAAYAKAQAAVQSTAAAHEALIDKEHTLGHEFEAMSATVENLGVSIGTKLLPPVATAVGDFAHFFEFIAGHKDILIALGAVAIPLVGAAIGVYLVGKVQSAVDSLGKARKSVEEFGQWLGNLRNKSQESASGLDESTSATDANTAALREGATQSALTAEAQESLGSGAKTAGAGMEEASGNAEQLSLGLDRVGESGSSAGAGVAEAGANMDKAGESAGALTEGLSGIEGSAGTAGASLGEVGAAAGEATASMEGLAAAAPEAGVAVDEAVGGMDAALDAGGIGEILMVVGAALMALVAIGEEVWHHWRGIATGLEDAWHGLEVAGEFVWHHLGEIVKDAGEAILVALLPMVGIPLLIATHWHAIETDAKKILGDVVDFVKTIPHKLVEAFGDAGSLLEKVGKEIFHGLELGFEYTSPIGLIIKFHTQILHGVEDAATWLLHAGEDVVKGLWHGIVATDELILGFGDKALHWLLSALSDAGTWLLHIGSEIVHGLVKGIEDVADLPGKAIHDVAHGVVSAAKDILGIFSPSTVFAEMGGNLMQSLAKGISENKSLATAELKALDLSKALVPALDKINQAGREMTSSLHGAATGMLELAEASRAAASILVLVGAIEAVAKALHTAGDTRLSAGLETDLKSLATLATSLNPGPITTALSEIKKGLDSLSSGDRISAGIESDDAALRKFAASLKPAGEEMTKLASELHTADSALSTSASEVEKFATSFDKADTASGKLGTNLHSIESDVHGMTEAITSAAHILGGELVTALDHDEQAAKKVKPAFDDVAKSVESGSQKVKASDGDWKTFGTDISAVLSTVNRLTTDLGHIATDMTKTGSEIGTVDTGLSRFHTEGLQAGIVIQTLDERLTAAVSPLHVLDGQLVTAHTTLNTFRSSVSEADSVLHTFDTSVTHADTDIGRMATGLKEVSTGATSFNNDLRTMDNELVITAKGIVDVFTVLEKEGFAATRTQMTAFNTFWATSWTADLTLFQNFWTSAQVTVNAIKAQGFDFLHTNLDTLRNAWQSDWQQMVTNLQTSQQQMNTSINAIENQGLAVLTTDINTLKGTWGSDWQSIAQAPSGTWQAVSGTFTSLEGGLTTLDTDVNTLNSNWGTAWSDMASALSSATSDAGTLLYSTGQALDTGLANGMAANTSDVVSQVNSTIGQVLTAAHAKAGVASPSTITHELGGDLMRGLSNGIDAFAFLPVQSMENAVDKVAKTKFVLPTPTYEQTGPSLGPVAPQIPTAEASSGEGNTIVTIESGAFVVEVHGAAHPEVTAAATSAVENGLSRLAATLGRGSSPVRIRR